MNGEKYLKRVCEAWKIRNPRPFINHALKLMFDNWDDKNVFVIEAPTGYGKSTISAVISLLSVEEDLKAVVCYPLKTLIEDQYATFTGKKGLKPICKEELIGIRYMNRPDSRYLIKPITLTTVDTFALTLFGIAPEDLKKALKAYESVSFSFGHYMVSWASAILSNVVLDEVHLLADSTKSLNLLIALVKLAVRFEQKLILLSATLPKAFKEILLESCREYRDRIALISFSKEHDEAFVSERADKNYGIEIVGLRSEEKFDRLLEILKSGLESYSRALVIFNTVEEAVEFYRIFKRYRDDFETILLHSRMSERDRARKVEKLKELKERYVIISTQVVEAGVNISSDFIITDIAPANSLVQRFGRFLRYEERSGKAVVWYEVEGGRLKLSLYTNRRPKNCVYIDTDSEDVFKICKDVCREVYGDVEVKKIGELRGRENVAIATPMYKVYRYELTLRTLEQLKEKKFNLHIPETFRNLKGYRELIDSVYSKKDFKVDVSKVDTLIRIHDYLESPEKAVETFLELEGSFVRDDLQVNVLSVEYVKNFVGKRESEIADSASEFFVPISLRILRSFDVLGLIFVNEEGFVEFEKIKKSERWKVGNPKIVLTGFKLEDGRFVSPLAFVVDAIYDKDVGPIKR